MTRVEYFHKALTLSPKYNIKNSMHDDADQGGGFEISPVRILLSHPTATTNITLRIAGAEKAGTISEFPISGFPRTLPKTKPHRCK